MTKQTTESKTDKDIVLKLCQDYINLETGRCKAFTCNDIKKEENRYCIC